MKKIITLPLISGALACSMLFTQTSFAGSSIERESRSDRIEALQQIVRDKRISRSKRVQAKLDLARLQSEARKDRRNADNNRSRTTAQRMH